MQCNVHDVTYHLTLLTKVSIVDRVYILSLLARLYDLSLLARVYNLSLLARVYSLSYWLGCVFIYYQGYPIVLFYVATCRVYVLPLCPNDV